MTTTEVLVLVLTSLHSVIIMSSGIGTVTFFFVMLAMLKYKNFNGPVTATLVQGSCKTTGGGFEASYIYKVNDKEYTYKAKNGAGGTKCYDTLELYYNRKKPKDADSAGPSSFTRAWQWLLIAAGTLVVSLLVYVLNREVQTRKLLNVRSP